MKLEIELWKLQALSTFAAFSLLAAPVNAGEIEPQLDPQLNLAVLALSRNELTAPYVQSIKVGFAPIFYFSQYNPENGVIWVDERLRSARTPLLAAVIIKEAYLVNKNSAGPQTSEECIEGQIESFNLLADFWESSSSDEPQVPASRLEETIAKSLDQITEDRREHPGEFLTAIKEVYAEACGILNL